jgi:tetratricopeptide (TPR) repeat protein
VSRPVRKLPVWRLVAAIMLLGVVVLLLAGQQNLAWCTEGRLIAPDQRIRACSRIIAHRAWFALLRWGEREAAFLARIHRNRGRGHRADHDYARAVADFDAAIRHDPDAAIAFQDRGSVQMMTMELDRAIADYAQAVRLGRRGALKDLGYARYAAGDFVGAVRDLTQAARYEPDELYVALWLYLAQRRSGNEGTGLARSLAGEAWPRPAVELFRGRMTPEALRAAARDYGERCEAVFYIGSWQALRDDPAAGGSFKTAAETCPHEFIERAGARAELRRGGAP